MTDHQTLLVLIAAILVNAIPAVRALCGTQHDAEVRARRLGAAVQGYTLRVISFLGRHPELSRDPEVRQALLPTPAETQAFGYRAPEPPPAPIPPRHGGAPHLPDCSPSLAAFLEEHLNAAASHRGKE